MPGNSVSLTGKGLLWEACPKERPWLLRGLPAAPAASEALRTGRRDGASGGEHQDLANALPWRSRACVAPLPEPSRRWARPQVAILLGTVITQGPGARDNAKETAFNFRHSGSDSSDGDIRKRRHVWKAGPVLSCLRRWVKGRRDGPALRAAKRGGRWHL